MVGESPLLMSARTFEVKGEPHNEVVVAEWTDEDGYNHSYHFQECGLAHAEVKGNAITARDEAGDDIIIQIFELKPVDILKEMES